MTRRRPATRFPAEVLSHEDVVALMSACPRSIPGQRNRALLALLYRSGLRLGEALALRPKDVDRATGAIRVLHGKGGRSRTCGADGDALGIVLEWMERRERWLDEHASIATSPIFCTRSGLPMAQAYFRRCLKRLARAAGIAKRVHAHGLRHTHAAQLRAERLDIGLISKQLGHASIATTALYLDHVAPLAVVEAMRARVWVRPA